MLKPLSQKSLDRLYDQLSLPDDDVELIHDYLLYFSNLYGSIEIADAYEIYHHYEKDCIPYNIYYDLIMIIQREDLPYYIIDLHEMYTGEPEDSEYYIVNKSLISIGYHKFIDIHTLDNNRSNNGYYLPEKEELVSFSEDLFYKTKEGLEMKEFIENLKTSGVGKIIYRPDYVIKDIDGNDVKGKKLKDFIFYSYYEQIGIEYEARSHLKDKFIEKYKTSASDKALDKIRKNIRIGNRFASANDGLENLLKFMSDDCGVEFDVDTLNRFMELYSDLNNNSNLWILNGYSPAELSKNIQHDGPLYIKVGDNLKRMLKENDEYDEYIEMLRSRGIMIINDDVVKLDEIINAMEDNNEDYNLYYSKKSGKIIMISNYDEYHDDEVFDYDDLISFPDRREINEYEMLKDFINIIDDEMKRECLNITIKGQGAFSRFKEMADYFGILDKWFEFKHERYKNLAIRWCLDNDIEYKD